MIYLTRSQKVYIFLMNISDVILHIKDNQDLFLTFITCRVLLNHIWIFNHIFVDDWFNTKPKNYVFLVNTFNVILYIVKNHYLFFTLITNTFSLEFQKYLNSFSITCSRLINSIPSKTVYISLCNINFLRITKMKNHSKQGISFYLDTSAIFCVSLKWWLA